MRVQKQKPLLSASRHFVLVFASLFIMVLCGFVHALVGPKPAQYGKHHCQEHQRRNKKSKPNPKHHLLATNIDEDGTESIFESPSFPQSEFGNLDDSPLPIDSSTLHPSPQSSSLEEILLSEHNALESFLAETGERQTSYDTSSVPEYTSSSTKNKQDPSIPYFLTPVPYFLQHDTKTTTSNSQDPKDVSNKSQEIDKTNDVYPEAASIDRAIYQFNNYLVQGLYVIISVLYPNDRKQQQSEATDTRMMINPLFGDEYNPTKKAETETTLGFEKFYVFETVARIPYFAYLSVLHLRETLRRNSNSNTNNEKRISTMRTHYAQADNELHHRLIMEALGGNDRPFDRILAHTLAFFYYWFVVVVFLWKEQAAYHLNEIVEDHAYRIYDEFLDTHNEELKALPVPAIAREYYETEYRKNPHVFEAFCAVSKNPTSATAKSNGNDSDSPRSLNRPHELHTLYDVFRNVRDDEREHWMALCNLVQYDDLSAVDEARVESTKETNG